MSIPIIKLEIQGMKHTVLAALCEHAAKLDESIQKAVEEFCSEGNVDQIIRQEADRMIAAVLKEEVQSFFGWSGAGRRAIREAVQERLSERYPEKDPG